MSQDNTLIDVKRAKKKKYSNQDVRKEALEVRDELLANIEFIKDVIREDRIKLQRYHEKFGDLRYRPVIRSGEHAIEPQYGNPTEVNIEPLASVYRATLNSLLQSIKLIQSDILPDDDPEGDTAKAKQDGDSAPRASIRESFTQQAGQQGKALEPMNDPEQEDEIDLVPVELVETKKPRAQTSISSTPAKKRTPEPKPLPEPKAPFTEPAPNSRPWRTKPQTTIVKSTHTEPTVEEPQKPISLQNPNILDADTERLRADLMGLRNNSNARMTALASKYGNKRKVQDDEDDES